VPAESHMLMTTLVSALTGLNRTGSSRRVWPVSGLTESGCFES
jgi:hypothetical protein